MDAAGIYIHIPFCKTKCPYCSFTSITPGEIPEKEYVSSVLKEIRLRRNETELRNIGTVYFGGGTPSLISPGGISCILSAISEKFNLVKPEITIEANPGAVDKDRLRSFRYAGVNRISIGIQTFNDRLLSNLGRSHSGKEALTAFESARQAGFDNIGIDLMHSIAGESLQDWKDDLRDAMLLHPEHISPYNLTIEEGTPFHNSQEKGCLVLPPDDEQADMLLATIETLCAAGYEHYEVSNYALPGCRSRHNQIYWKGGNYIGLGVSAHSYYRKGWGVRMANSPDLTYYIDHMNNDAAAVVEEEILTRAKAMTESIFLGLRMMEGININDFESRFGIKIEEAYKDTIEELTTEGFLIHDNDHLKLTGKGLLFSNDVALRFA